MNSHLQPAPLPPPARRVSGRCSLPWPLLAALLLLWVAGQPSLTVAAAADTVVVVVNAANSTPELSADDISKMFLKKTASWPHGEKVMPVDLLDTSPLRQAFSKQVHGKTTAAVKAYWQKMIFSGQDVPPPEKSSIAEALAYVRNNVGGIGYAPTGADLGPGVKVLKVKP